MKKFLAFALCALMLVSMLALVGCGDDTQDTTKTETTKGNTTESTKTPDNNNDNNDNNDNSDNSNDGAVKFGSALYVSGVAATDADEENNGKGSMTVTAAAVIVGADGKIIACDLDTMQNEVAFTIDGKAIANNGFKTKRELGDNYNMVTYGGAKQEWYKQADAFEALIVGKTITEIKALIAEGNKGNDEVVAAGCTIMINEFVAAIEKAVANAKTEVAADATLKVTMHTAQECTDATADDAGSNKVSVYTFAAAMKDGKVVTADSDCVEADFKFDDLGFVDFDAAKEIKSKREQGDNYNMVTYGGAVAEWYAQADAFDAACEGKTGAEIAGLMGADYKGIDSLQAAGCTIYVSGFVAAASKI